MSFGGTHFMIRTGALVASTVPMSSAHGRARAMSSVIMTRSYTVASTVHMTSTALRYTPPILI